MKNHARSILFCFLCFAQSFAAFSQNDKIVTDRPGRMNATTSVGRGVFQAEIGAFGMKVLDKDLKSETYGYNQTVLRYGVGNGTELRLGHDLAGMKYKFRDKERDLGLSNQSMIGFKQALTADPNAKAKMAIVGQWFVPLKDGKYNKDISAIDVSLPMSLDISEIFSFGLMPGISVNDLTFDHTKYYGSFFLTYSPSGNFSVYSQWYWETSEYGRKISPPFDFVPGVGGTYRLNDNSQLDLSFEMQSEYYSIPFQTSKTYNKLYVGVGYSLRLVNSNK